MRKKYKKKKTKKLVIALFVLIVTLSAGYSIFSETINVSGTASSDIYFINDNKLRISLIGPDYATGTWSAITLNNESYDGTNNLSSTFTNTAGGGVSQNESITVSFTNSYGYNMTSGTASIQVISGTFQATNIALQKTTLTPSEQGNYVVSITYKGKDIGTAELLCTIQYTTNSTVQYFYHTIYIN